MRCGPKSCTRRSAVTYPGASIVVSESEAGDGGGYVDSLAGVQLDDYAGFLLIPSAAAKGGEASQERQTERRTA